MSLDLIAGPAVEPVSLVDAKTHLRVDGTAEDAFITTLVITSRLHIEAALGLALVTQRWVWRLDRWADNSEIDFPLRPVASVESVRISDASGAMSTVPPSSYAIDGLGNPARLAFNSTPPRAAGTLMQGIEIEFTAGFGSAASDVPEPIRHAILLLVAHWYENREPVVSGSAPVPIPVMVSELLLPYRTVRL